MSKGTPLGEYTPGEKFVRGPVSFVLGGVCLAVAGLIGLDIAGQIDVSEAFGVSDTTVAVAAGGLAATGLVVWFLSNTIDTHD